MTVAEPIERLRQEDPAALVVVSDERGGQYVASDIERAFARRISITDYVETKQLKIDDRYVACVEIG